MMFSLLKFFLKSSLSKKDCFSSNSLKLKSVKYFSLSKPSNSPQFYQFCYIFNLLFYFISFIYLLSCLIELNILYILYFGQHPIFYLIKHAQICFKELKKVSAWMLLSLIVFEESDDTVRHFWQLQFNSYCRSSKQSSFSLVFFASHDVSIITVNRFYKKIKAA